jgi:hypothetical protein
MDGQETEKPQKAGNKEKRNSEKSLHEILSLLPNLNDTKIRFPKDYSLKKCPLILVLFFP